MLAHSALSPRFLFLRFNTQSRVQNIYYFNAQGVCCLTQVPFSEMGQTLLCLHPIRNPDLECSYLWQNFPPCTGKNDLDKRSHPVQPGYNLTCIVLVLQRSYTPCADGDCMVFGCSFTILVSSYHNATGLILIQCFIERSLRLVSWKKST